MKALELAKISQNEYALLSSNEQVFLGKEFQRLAEVNAELLEALEKMCAWHELQATCDKGNNGYYVAKRLIAKAKEQQS